VSSTQLKHHVAVNNEADKGKMTIMPKPVDVVIWIRTTLMATHIVGPAAFPRSLDRSSGMG
jgi:hypothetical protein